MLKKQPTLDSLCWNQYQVWAQVDKVKSHFIHTATDNTAERYDSHRIESDAEH